MAGAQLVTKRGSSVTVTATFRKPNKDPQQPLGLAAPRRAPKVLLLRSCHQPPASCEPCSENPIRIQVRDARTRCSHAVQGVLRPQARVLPLLGQLEGKVPLCPLEEGKNLELRGRIWNRLTPWKCLQLTRGQRQLLGQQAQNLLFWSPQLAACAVCPAAFVSELTQRCPKDQGKRCSR